MTTRPRTVSAAARGRYGDASFDDVEDELQAITSVLAENLAWSGAMQEMRAELLGRGWAANNATRRQVDKTRAPGTRGS